MISVIITGTLSALCLVLSAILLAERTRRRNDSGLQHRS